MPPTLQHAFTLDVSLSPPLEFGTTPHGYRRFIPITGGRISGPRLNATILPGGGDWNAIRGDGMGHLLAKYTIKTDDGVLVSVTNEGWIRKFLNRKVQGQGQGETGKGEGKVEEESWYAKTNPRFEVQDGPHGWLNRTVFIGDLRKPRVPDRVTIDVYAVEEDGIAGAKL